MEAAELIMTRWEQGHLVLDDVIDRLREAYRASKDPHEHEIITEAGLQLRALSNVFERIGADGRAPMRIGCAMKVGEMITFGTCPDLYRTTRVTRARGGKTLFEFEPVGKAPRIPIAFAKKAQDVLVNQRGSK